MNAIGMRGVHSVRKRTFYSGNVAFQMANVAWKYMVLAPAELYYTVPLISYSAPSAQSNSHSKFSPPKKDILFANNSQIAFILSVNDLRGYFPGRTLKWLKLLSSSNVNISSFMI